MVCEPTFMKVVVSLVKLSSLFLLSGRLIFEQIMEDSLPLYITLACRIPCQLDLLPKHLFRELSLSDLIE
jgi:hypothetical protein